MQYFYGGWLEKILGVLQIHNVTPLGFSK